MLHVAKREKPGSYSDFGSSVTELVGFEIELQKLRWSIADLLIVSMFCFHVLLG